MSKYSRSHFPPHHFFIQNKLILAINDPSFQLVLPELRQSTWNRVLHPGSSDDDERERLEFVGDALMHASIALELYRLYPRGTPHLYTVLRAALNTNCTFTQYMLKVGAFVRPRHQPKASADAFDKIAADAFETLIAAYHFEQGFQAVCTWVSVTLKPLIIVARKAYDEFLAGIRPTQRLDKGLRAEMDIYLAGKKTRPSIQPEPSHSLGSNHAQVVTRDEGTPSSFSVSQAAEHCQAVVNNTDGKLPADYHTDRKILGSLKSPTEATNLGSKNQAAAASPMHDHHSRPPSRPKRDDFGVNLIADGAETNKWTGMDVQSDVASNGSAHLNGPASDRRSLLTPPLSLDASQLLHTSSLVPSSAFKRPGTRRSRRILRALQQLHKTPDLEVIAGIVKISQVSKVDERHVPSSPVASSFSGSGGSNTSGSASGVFSLQSLTWQLLSTHSLPKYPITEKLGKVSMKDLPTANSRRSRHQRRKAGLRASRDIGLRTLDASANDNVLNVAIPMSILPHIGAQETALGTSDNPIVVDNDDDVEMTHA